MQVYWSSGLKCHCGRHWDFIWCNDTAEFIIKISALVLFTQYIYRHCVQYLFSLVREIFVRVGKYTGKANKMTARKQLHDLDVTTML